MPTAARSLPAQTLTGNFNLASDTDLFQFTGNAGDRVVITATATSTGITPEIFFYPPGGGDYETTATGLATNKRLDHQLLQSGTYTIVVQDYALDTTGTYALSLAKIPGAATSPTDADGGTSLPAQTLTGNFNLASDTDLFQFTGNAGDRVVITATSTSTGIAPEIFLYPPGGGAYESNATGLEPTNGSTISCCSPAPTPSSSRTTPDTTGNYAISLAKIPGAATSPTDADGGTILPAQTLTGNFNLASDTDLFQFTGNASDRVVITATSPAAASRRSIFFYPPGGGASETAGAGSPTYARPSAAAVRHLHHRHPGLRLDTTGTYAISLAKIPGAATSPTDTDGGTILPAQTLTGTLNLASDTDLFQFTGNAGDRVVITAYRHQRQRSAGLYSYPPGGGDYETFAGAGLASSVTARPSAASVRHLHHRHPEITPAVPGPAIYAISLAKMPGAVNLSHRH